MISHFSLSSFQSVLQGFALRATVMCQLRSFAQSIFEASYAFPSTSTATKSSTSRTLEAFAAAVDAEVRRFDSWCAAEEEKICQSRSGRKTSEPVICSLLNLEYEVSKSTGTSFDLLLNLIRDLQSMRPPEGTVRFDGGAFDFSFLQPAVLSTLILDYLLAAIRSEQLKGLEASAEILMNVFIHTIEPLWGSVGAWMKHGMDFADTAATSAVAVDENAELFIARNFDVPTGTTDFWMEGHSLRSCSEHDEKLLMKLRSRRPDIGSSEVHNDDAVPSIFRDFAPDILSAGKSVGLLRALQIEDFFMSGEEESSYQWMEAWPSFHLLVRSSDDSFIVEQALEPDGDDGDTRASFGDSTPSGNADNPMSKQNTRQSVVSSEEIASLIRERLDPWCRLAHARLNRVILDDCDLWHHLAAIQGLYFMKRGDTMGRFCDALFERVSLENLIVLTCSSMLILFSN